MFYNPYPSIDLPFGKENKYFLQFFESVLRVDEKYLTYNIDYGEGRKEYFSHLERVFAYELYRQWGNQIELAKDPLVLNAEIKKVINGDYYICHVIDENGETIEQEFSVYPDIVLHHSQGDDNSQIMICEIKRAVNSYHCQVSELTGSAIFGDIHKILGYMTKLEEGKNPFKYGVFLVVNGGLSIITSKLKSNTKIKISKGQTELVFSDFINEKASLHLFQRIVCVAYDGSRLEYDTFDNIIKNRTINNPNE